MGRSEAPLPSDSNGEESLEEPTENHLGCAVEDPSEETFARPSVERVHGVDSKYNEQDGQPQLNSDYSPCRPTNLTIGELE